jgi:copper resistance protein D
MSEPIVLARIAHFAATLLAGGTVSFLVLIAQPAADNRLFLGSLERRCRLTVWAALAVAIVSGAIWMVLLAVSIAGETATEAMRDGTLWTLASQTRFGQVWGIRFALAVLLSALLPYSAAPAPRYASLALAAGFIALLALVGHSGATPGTAGPIYLAVDILHLLAAGAWLGALPGLALLLAMARHAGDGSSLEIATRAVRRFSDMGVVGVGILLITGSINAWHLLGGVDALFTGVYGRLLSIKIALFAIMVAVATVNRLRLVPRLPASDALRALLRNVAAETVLGLCIVAIVGALGTMAPHDHVHAHDMASCGDASGATGCSGNRP